MKIFSGGRYPHVVVTMEAGCTGDQIVEACDRLGAAGWVVGRIRAQEWMADAGGQVSFAAYAPVDLEVSAGGDGFVVTAARATMADLVAELDRVSGAVDSPVLDDLHARLVSAAGERLLPFQRQIAKARKLMRCHPALPEDEADLVRRAHHALDVLKVRAPKGPGETVMASDLEKAALADLDGAVRGLGEIRRCSAELFVLHSGMRSGSMDVVVQVVLPADVGVAVRDQLALLRARANPWEIIVVARLHRALRLRTVPVTGTG